VIESGGFPLVLSLSNHLFLYRQAQDERTKIAAPQTLPQMHYGQPPKNAKKFSYFQTISPAQ
jgi:hypothetical protein